MIEIPNQENPQKNEDEINIPSIQNNPSDFSLNKLYISILIVLFLIMTYTMGNEKKILKKIKDQIEEDFRNDLKKYMKKDTLKDPRVGLCVIGKNENKYAKEYVDHYKSIGFNHIFIYDNNDKEGEHFEEVLSEDIAKNYVSIINYRNRKDQPQFKAYNDCYEKNSKNYEWLAFYDFDEFLHLKKHKTIQEFVEEEKFNNCTNIKINWIIYGDNDLIYYENKPVQERFTIPASPQCYRNTFIKSLIRGNLPTNYWSNMKNPHTSDNDYICCLATGEITDSKNFFNKLPNYDEAYIKHYATKSLEEYIDKGKRGRSDLKVVFNEEYWKNKFIYYFDINNKTKEKLDYIKNTLQFDFN